MISKKILFPLAAIAMASFVACGDDSSSGSPASGNTAPASVPTFMDIDNYECSATVNKCAKVYIEDKNDTMQCDGVNAWRSLVSGPIAGCEATPATDGPAITDPAENPSANDSAAVQEPAGPGAGEEPAGPGAGEEPAGPGAGEEPAGPGAGEEPAGPGAGEEPAGPGAGEEPAGPGAGEEPAGPGAGEEPTGPGAGEEPADPGAGEEPADSGDRVSCLKESDFVCAEGPSSFVGGCVEEEGEVVVDQCPAGGEACDIGENDIIMYLYEGYGLNCAQLKAFMNM